MASSPRRRARLTALWRALVGVSGLGGYLLATREFDSAISALSQQASLLAGVSYLALAALALVRPDVDRSWTRGALASLLALVAVGYALLLDPDYGPVYSLLEHLVTPLLVVGDYLFIDRRPGRWWWPLSWALLPIAYLVYYLADDLDIYGFLDPSAAGFGLTLVALIAGFLAIAYLLLATVRFASRRQ